MPVICPDRQHLQVDAWLLNMKHAGRFMVIEYKLFLILDFVLTTELAASIIAKQTVSRHRLTVEKDRKFSGGRGSRGAGRSLSGIPTLPSRLLPLIVLGKEKKEKKFDG